MTSRHGVRPLRLMVVAAVIALLSTLFATAAHAGTGSITGKVTKASGSALSGLTVDAYKVSGDEYIYVKSATTRSDGTYTLGSLDKGRYVVGFGEDALKYATEYWNNKRYIEDATTISVSTSRVSSINAKMSSGGAIRGTIQKAGGAPVEDAEIGVYQESPDGDDLYYLTSVLSKADGSYLAGGLVPGRYRLEFNPPWDGPDSDLALEYWDDMRTLEQSNRISVGAGQVSEATNAVLAAGGRVSGRVTGSDGEPIEGVLVFGYPGYDEGDVGNFAVTQADGTYLMKGLSPGVHRMEFVGPMDLDLNIFDDERQYAAEWWKDGITWVDADRFTVDAGVTTSGIDAQLARYGDPAVNLEPPSISGEPQVGEPLMGDPGRWSPDVAPSMRWYADGVLLADQLGSEFYPQLEHVGKKITLEVSPRPSGPPVMSAPTEPIGSGGPLINTAKPSLRDTEQVGNTLRITPGEWTAYDVSRTHQVLADGVEVPGATGSFDITPDLLGKRLSVRETVTRPGRATTTVTSEETPPVGPGTIRATGGPGYDGPAIVGVPLTTTNGHWSVSGNEQVERYEYEWLANGTPIAGADEATFTPTTAEAGKLLRVRVTALRDGYTSASAASASENAVAEHGELHVDAGEPTISGEVRIGRTIEAVPGNRWSPAPHRLTIEYQWLTDGEAIASATEKTFTVTSAQAGKTIAVRMTGSRPGYTSATAVSPGQVVPTTTPFGAPQDLRSTDESISTIDLAWTEVDDAVKYRIYYGIGSGSRTRVEVGDLTATTLEGLKAGVEYSIDIAAIKADGTRSAYSPRVSILTTPLATPTNVRVYSHSPTVLEVTWTPVPDIPRHRVYYGIGTGTRTRVDVGKNPFAYLQGLRPNTTYSIDVASMSMSGQRSAYTPRIEFTTDPFLPPTNLASRGATSSTIDLTWTRAPAATNYRIYYGIGSGTRTRVDVGNESNRTVTGLKSGTTYNIDIAAILPDGTKSAYSPRINVTTD